MSYYKHIKTVQAFQLGIVVPIAPRNFGGRGRPLVLQPEDLSQDFNPISITPVGVRKARNEAAAAKAYIDKIPSYVEPVDRKATKDFIAKIPKYVNPVDRQSTKDFIAKIPKYVNPVDRQSTKDFIAKIPSYVEPVDRQATKDFIAKIPSYVEPEDRKAVVDKAKAETKAETKKTNTVAKDSPEVARNKRIQRSLGVTPDGVMGKDTKAAIAAMKQTQISLGFTGKDVDGIRGVKTNAAMAARDMQVHDAIKPVVITKTLLDRDETITIPRTPQTNKEMRQEKRAYRRTQRELDKAPVEFDYKRNGGIFYCPTK
jgi:hypothetical protein